MLNFQLLFLWNKKEKKILELWTQNVSHILEYWQNSEFEDNEISQSIFLILVRTMKLNFSCQTQKVSRKNHVVYFSNNNNELFCIWSWKSWNPLFFWKHSKTHLFIHSTESICSIPITSISLSSVEKRRRDTESKNDRVKRKIPFHLFVRSLKCLYSHSYAGKTQELVQNLDFHMWGRDPAT